jgi:predicted nicotinamide N-methyase
VELGAGLGLPSIVASKLGVEMIATDGAFRFFFRRRAAERASRIIFFSPTATNAIRREVALVNPSAGPLRVLGVSRRAHMTP